MAKIILKSPYLKPNTKTHTARYVNYIATRDGVEKPLNSKQEMQSTDFQKKTISSLLKDYPDTRDLYEYADYVKKSTRENADEFIMRVAETHSELFGTRQKYVDYIATRPNVVNVSTHGLFSDSNNPIVLSKVAEEVANHRGNVWTHIISLRREDADRLGYNNVDEWQELLRSQRNIIAKNMKIKPENFRWYAAFHNADHHPHVHMVAYSIDPNEAYLTGKGIDTIKSSLTKQIFRQDLIQVYERQTKSRDLLRSDSREFLRDIIVQVNSGNYNNPVVSELLFNLSRSLSEHKGKKQYGYLNPEVKATVDRIVDELSADSRISAMYDLWYEQKYKIVRTYTDTMPKKIPLSQNQEFKTIKNAVIQEALNLLNDRTVILNENEEQSETQTNDNTTTAKQTTQYVDSTVHNDNTNVALGSFRLLAHLSQLLKNRIEKDANGKRGVLDRKQKQKENEKKQAQGLKIE